MLTTGKDNEKEATSDENPYLIRKTETWKGLGRFIDGYHHQIQSIRRPTDSAPGEEYIVILGFSDIELVTVPSAAFAFILKHDLCPLTSAVFEKLNLKRFTAPLADHVFFLHRRCPSFVNRMCLLEPNDAGMCGFVCLQLFSLFLGTNLLRCEAMQHFIGDKTKQRLDRDFFLLTTKHMRKFLVGEMEKDLKETTPYFPNSPIVPSMFRYPGLTEPEWKDLVINAMEEQVRCIFDPDAAQNLYSIAESKEEMECPHLEVFAKATKTRIVLLYYWMEQDRYSCLDIDWRTPKPSFSYTEEIPTFGPEYDFFRTAVIMNAPTCSFVSGDEITWNNQKNQFRRHFTMWIPAGGSYVTNLRTQRTKTPATRRLQTKTTRKKTTRASSPGKPTKKRTPQKISTTKANSTHSTPPVPAKSPARNKPKDGAPKVHEMDANSSATENRSKSTTDPAPTTKRRKITYIDDDTSSSSSECVQPPPSVHCPDPESPLRKNPESPVEGVQPPPSVHCPDPESPLRKNPESPVGKNPGSPVRRRGIGIRSTEAVLNRAHWKKPIPLPIPPTLNEYEEQCVLTELPNPAAEQDVQNLIKTGKCILCSHMLSQDEKDLFRYLARAEAGKLSPKQKKLLSDHAAKAHPTLPFAFLDSPSATISYNTDSVKSLLQEALFYAFSYHPIGIIVFAEMNQTRTDSHLKSRLSSTISAAEQYLFRLDLRKRNIIREWLVGADNNKRKAARVGMLAIRDTGVAWFRQLHKCCLAFDYVKFLDLLDGNWSLLWNAFVLFFQRGFYFEKPFPPMRSIYQFFSNEDTYSFRSMLDAAHERQGSVTEK